MKIKLKSLKQKKKNSDNSSVEKEKKSKSEKRKSGQQAEANEGNDDEDAGKSVGLLQHWYGVIQRAVIALALDDEGDTPEPTATNSTNQHEASTADARATNDANGFFAVAPKPADDAGVYGAAMMMAAAPVVDSVEPALVQEAVDGGSEHSTDEGRVDDDSQSAELAGYAGGLTQVIKQPMDLVDTDDDDDDDESSKMIEHIREKFVLFLKKKWKKLALGENESSSAADSKSVRAGAFDATRSADDISDNDEIKAKQHDDENNNDNNNEEAVDKVNNNSNSDDDEDDDDDDEDDDDEEDDDDDASNDSELSQVNVILVDDDDSADLAAPIQEYILIT